VLDIIAKAYLKPGDRSIVPIPTYSMYGVLTDQRDARIEAVPRQGPDGGFALDMPAMLAALPGASAVWLTVPNNPTGAPESAADVEALLQAGARLDGGGPVFVIDEAYIEFHPGSLVELTRRYPSLIVVRTMSKAFALAGLRIGYGVAQRGTIARLERFRPPGSVSTVSASIAAQALRRPEVARANADAIIAEREWLAGQLAAAGLAPYPSVTNFLLVRIGTQAQAESATEHLLRNGIVPRTFGPANPLRGHLRFTVRDRAGNERLLEVIKSWVDGRSA
jgi:histidinol-phosphate aminotransferase